MILCGLGDIHGPAWAVLALAAREDSPVNFWWWTGFGLLILVLVMTSRLAFHRHRRDPSLAESAVSVAVWCLVALAFNAVIAWRMGANAGLQFATGYLLEWSLSVDNVFAFAVIFRYFQVPKADQHRILFWGILGAVLMRLTFILAGAALISRFQFILPLFGLFLIYASYHLAWRSSERSDPERNLVFRFARRWLPLADGRVGFIPPPSSHEDGLKPILQSTPPAADDYGGRFLVRQAGRLKFTLPFVVLLVIEGTDLLFAVDSIPAIFGVTRDPFIIFTSNVFAILGLRALYFLLAGVMDRFRYLHYGLAAVLAFVGLKMVAEGWRPGIPGAPQGAEFMPTWASLAVIAALLGTAVVASIMAGKKKPGDLK